MVSETRGGETSCWPWMSGTRDLQTLLYYDNWKIWLKLLTDNKMQREAHARTVFVFLAYSSLRMEANLWAWIYILDLAPVVLILYPSMELHLMSKMIVAFNDCYYPYSSEFSL